MLYLKPANLEDIEKEHAFVAAEPADENGFINDYHGISFEDFKSTALPSMMDFSLGKNLPEGYVPETFYFLWSDEGNPDDRTNHVIVGELRLRHYLNASLENGSGHVGQFIKKEYRGLGYCTKGLKLLIEEAKKIVPENELYLHCNIDNPASLRVMIKNGGVIHHKDQSGYYVRIKLPFSG